MTLVRWRNQNRLSPWSPLGDLEAHFDALFYADRAECGGAAKSWAPAIDLRETEDAYILEADVPGLKREEVRLEILENVLTIKGERTRDAEENTDQYRHVERGYGRYERSVKVPGGFDADGVEATFEHGVLTVVLPKRPESKTRQIEVKGK